MHHTQREGTDRAADRQISGATKVDRAADRQIGGATKIDRAADRQMERDRLMLKQVN